MGLPEQNLRILWHYQLLPEHNQSSVKKVAVYQVQAIPKLKKEQKRVKSQWCTLMKKWLCILCPTKTHQEHKHLNGIQIQMEMMLVVCHAVLYNKCNNKDNINVNINVNGITIAITNINVHFLTLCIFDILFYFIIFSQIIIVYMFRNIIFIINAHKGILMNNISISNNIINHFSNNWDSYKCDIGSHATIMKNSENNNKNNARDMNNFECYCNDFDIYNYDSNKRQTWKKFGFMNDNIFYRIKIMTSVDVAAKITSGHMISDKNSSAHKKQRRKSEDNTNNNDNNNNNNNSNKKQDKNSTVDSILSSPENPATVKRKQLQAPDNGNNEVSWHKRVVVHRIPRQDASRSMWNDREKQDGNEPAKCCILL